MNVVTLKDIQSQFTKLGEMLNTYAKLAEENKNVSIGSDPTQKVLATFKDPIKLGQIFMASKSTLMKHESMLSSIFSGRYAIEQGSDGAYFIDRDPKHFSKILNFLRDGTIDKPNNDTERNELVREAEFYKMTSLIQHLTTVATITASTPANEGDDLDKLLAHLTANTPTPDSSTTTVVPATKDVIPKPESNSVPKVWDPIRMGKKIWVQGDTISTVDDISTYAYLATTFTTGFHSVTFKWTGREIFPISVCVTGKLYNWTQRMYYQPEAMGLTKGGTLFVAGEDDKALFAIGSSVTMELDCDNRTITFINPETGERHTEPLRENTQPPYTFGIDFPREAGKVTIAALE